MAFSAGAPGGRNEQTFSSRGMTGSSSSSSAGSSDWAEPEQEPRDWKKIILVVGLGTLSWAATYIGMLELIQANIGDLPILHKLLIGFSVAMLMTMIIWLLDQIFSASNYGAKFFFILGYVFLTVISVGFGFGFYWKVLESRSESTRSAEAAISGVQNSLHAGFTRMNALNQTLVELEKVSTAKAVEEREKGTSCPNSRPGDGPRRKLRDADAASFRFASQFVTRRVGSVQTDLGALDVDLKKVASRDASTFDPKTGTRNKFLRDLNRRLELTVTGFNAFRGDPQLLQIRSDLNDRAGKTVFPNGNRTFACPDPQLQAALRGVVRAIDQLPVMRKPEIAAVEGSEATIEAFRRLTASIMGILTFSPPLSPDEIRQLQKKAVQSVSGSGSSSPANPAYAPPSGLGKRDYVPLAIAIFVDMCLLLVSIGRPLNRLNNLIPKMREAEKGPVIQILSRFNEIHRDPEVRQNFEVFRHVVFDYLGDYYVAVPLDTPYNRVGNNGAPYYGTAQAQDLQDEAHLLANLFASFEKEKIFKRVYFVPTRTVRNRLNRQGSKFAGSNAFRLYRFKEGAWSDIILGAVMGAAKRVEAEKELRLADLDQQIKDRGPALDARGPSPKTSRNSDHEFPVAAGGAQVGRNGRGEAGPSGKAAPKVIGDAPDDTRSRFEKNDANHNGFFANGHVNSDSNANSNGSGHANGNTNGHATLNGGADNGKSISSMLSSSASDPIFIYDDFGGEEFDDRDLDDLTSEDEDQIRSRYGKYAEKILKERTYAVSRKKMTVAGNQDTDSDELTDDTTLDFEEMPNLAVPDLKEAAANSNTVPALDVDTDILDVDTKFESEGEIEVDEKGTDIDFDASKIISLPTATSSSQNGEATVTLTRESATYTVPVSSAVLPMSLQQTGSATQQVVVTQAVQKEQTENFAQPAQVVIDALARAIPNQATDLEPAHDESAEVVEALKLTPPPLPEVSSNAPTVDNANAAIVTALKPEPKS